MIAFGEHTCQYSSVHALGECVDLRDYLWTSETMSKMRKDQLGIVLIPIYNNFYPYGNEIECAQCTARLIEPPP